eukprot:2347774-Amphidinium_carterae.2
MYSEATNTFLTDLEATQMLDTNLTWKLAWWTLELKARPLTFLRADLVSVVAMDGGEHEDLWPPPKKQRTKTKASEGTWAEALASKPHPPRPATQRHQNEIVGSEVQRQKQHAPLPQAETDMELPAHEIDVEPDMQESDLDWDVDDLFSNDDPDEVEDDATLDLLSAVMEHDLDLQALFEKSMGSNKAAGVEREEYICQEDQSHAAQAHVGSGSAASTEPGPAMLASSSAEAVSSAAALDPTLPPKAEEPSTSNAQVAVPKAPSLIVRGIRCAAEASVIFGGGRLTYYHSKDCFEASCLNRDHGSCKLTRTVKGRTLKKKLVAGRPLGAMAVWLQQHAVPDKSVHKIFDNETYSFANRKAARELLKSTPGADELFEHERAKASGEESEPETLAGLL